MSNTAHIFFEQPTGGEMLSGSANWAFDNGIHTIFDPRIGAVGRTLSQWALAVLLAVSSTSSGPDPWSDNRQQRSQLTMSALVPGESEAAHHPARSETTGPGDSLSC